MPHQVVAMFTRNEELLPPVNVEIEGKETAEEVFEKAQGLSEETKGASPAMILTPEGRMIWYDAHVL